MRVDLASSLGRMGSATGCPPDQRFREYIVKGIKEGFRIGFDYSQKCQASKRNMSSAEEKAEVVHNYLQTEVLARRVLGPLDPAD